MNTSIPEPDSPPTISNLTPAREVPSIEPPMTEPTLTRVPQEDPNGPPLFELRPEYMIDVGSAPSRLRGAIGKVAAKTGDLLLSAAYFLGLGAFAPLVRSRDPLGLVGKGSGRWLCLSTAQRSERADSRG